jgi:hypothetical protein
MGGMLRDTVRAVNGLVPFDALGARWSALERALER